MKKLFVILNLIIISLFAVCCSVETPQGHYDKQPAGSLTGLYAYLEVSCSAVLDNIESLDPALKNYVPQNGVIIEKTKIEIRKNDTALKFLTDALTNEKVLYDVRGGYVYSINHIREKCCGPESGWIIFVNGKFLGSGANSYYVKESDIVQWMFSCKKGDLYDGL